MSTLAQRIVSISNVANSVVTRESFISDSLGKVIALRAKLL